MSPKLKRKYSTKKKTTTRQGKREYMRPYMQDYRAGRTLKSKFLQGAIKQNKPKVALRIVNMKPIDVKKRAKEIEKLVWGNERR